MKYQLTLGILLSLLATATNWSAAQEAAEEVTPTEESTESKKPTPTPEDVPYVPPITTAGRAEDMMDIIRLTESLESRVASLRLLNRRVQRLLDRATSEFQTERSRSVRRLQSSVKDLKNALNAPTSAPNPAPPATTEAAAGTTTTSPVPTVDYEANRIYELLQDISNAAERCSSLLEYQLGTLDRSIRDYEDQLDAVERNSGSSALAVRTPLRPQSPEYDPFFSQSPPRSSLNFTASLGNLGVDDQLPKTLEEIFRALNSRMIRGDGAALATKLGEASTKLDESVTKTFDDRLKSLTQRAETLKKDAASELSLLEKNLKTQQVKRRQIEGEFRKVDAQVQQLGINEMLVYAVYAMIGAIIFLFAALWLFPTDLSTRIIDQRVLIEVLSMGFLLLTVIILGTGKVLEKEGLAALLGTIAGYIFARKAAEFADDLQAERLNRQIVSATTEGGETRMTVAPAPPTGRTSRSRLADVQQLTADETRINGPATIVEPNSEVAESHSAGDSQPGQPSTEEPVATTPSTGEEQARTDNASKSVEPPK